MALFRLTLIAAFFLSATAWAEGGPKASAQCFKEDYEKVHAHPDPSTHTAPTATRKVISNEKGNGVTWGNSVFRNIEMHPISFGRGGANKTIAYTSSQGPTIKDAKTIMIFLHGMNATTSNAGSMLGLVQGFARPAKNLDPQTAWGRANQKSPKVEGVYAEAIDLPGCGNNSNLKPLESLQATIDYYKSYLQDVRSRSNGQPIVVVSRGYSVGYSVQAVRELPPGMIAGQVLLGGIRPDEGGTSFQSALEAEKKQIENGDFSPDPEVQKRTNRTYAKLKWGTEKNPFKLVPTLVMTGELGVLRPTPERPEGEVEALAAVNDFIKEVTSEKKGASIPPGSQGPPSGGASSRQSPLSILGARRFREYSLASQLIMPVQIPIGPESIARKNPEIIDRIRQIEKLTPILSSFSMEFAKFNKGAPPKLKDMIDYVLERRDQISIQLWRLAEEVDSQGLHELAEGLREHSNTLRVTGAMVNEIQGRMQKSLALYQQRFDLSNDAMRDELYPYFRKIPGSLGEVNALIRLDQVQSQSVTFGVPQARVNEAPRLRAMSEYEKSMEKLVDSKIDEFRTAIKFNPGYINKFASKYPDFFAYGNLASNLRDPLLREGSLRWLKNWMKDKEIDLVRKSETGKIVWTEIKNEAYLTVDALTFKKSRDGGRKSKSILDQLKEQLFMRDFLGLEDQVNVELVAVSGMDQGAYQTLVANGILGVPRSPGSIPPAAPSSGRLPR